MKKIILTLLVFIGLSFSAFQGQPSGAVLLDRVVAVVNNEVITWSELRNTFEIEGKEILKGLAGEEREKKIKEMSKQFLNHMIDIKLQLQAARDSGLDVGSSETEAAIADIKKKYTLTDEAFVESLKTEGLTFERYKEELKRQILISKTVRYNVGDTIFIDDKEIEKYYESHKEQYRSREKVRIRQIFFAKSEDHALKAGMETRALEIIKRIKEGEDFAKMAKEFSEDASKEFGGDLGYINRGSALKEIEKEAFRLSPGEISKPFWSSSGLHILKLEDKKEVITIDEVRKDIKELLFKEAFESKYENWVKTLREKAYVEIHLEN